LAAGRLNRSPLYRQLKGLLEELIKSDEFKVGDQFLTERQIAERFDVSRVTANKALTSLVDEGVLSFRKGVGTFVQDTSFHLRFGGAVSSFTNRTLAAGRKPSTRVLRFDHVNASALPAWIRSRMPISDTEQMIIVERLRLADEVPMILERHNFRARFFPGLLPEHVKVSVYEMITKRYGINLAVVDETIRTIDLKGANAKLFGVPDGTPGFLMHFLPFNDRSAPLYLAEVIYRGDAYEFHNRLGPIQRTHPLAEDPGDFCSGNIT
jgi:GntR family transcriptional regulator